MVAVPEAMVHLMLPDMMNQFDKCEFKRCFWFIEFCALFCSKSLSAGRDFGFKVPKFQRPYEAYQHGIDD